MTTPHSYLRLALMLTGLSLNLSTHLPRVFSEETTPQDTNTILDDEPDDGEEQLPSSARSTLEKNLPRSSARRMPLRPATFISKPIGPEALRTTPFDLDQFDQENSPIKQRSFLIPTVWDQAQFLIPTEIDAQFLKIQQVGGSIPEATQATTPTRYRKALPSVRSTTYSRARISRRNVLPEQMSGPGYDTKYFPVVPVNSGLGIATFPLKSQHPTKSPSGVAPNNDPELIRQEIIKSLRTPGYRGGVTPPTAKELQNAPLVEAKKGPKIKLVAKPKPVQPIHVKKAPKPQDE